MLVPGRCAGEPCLRWGGGEGGFGETHWLGESRTVCGSSISQAGCSQAQLGRYEHHKLKLLLVRTAQRALRGFADRP